MRRSSKASSIQTDCQGNQYAAQYNAHVCAYEAWLETHVPDVWLARLVAQGEAQWAAMQRG
jgi:hypothetical protein